MICKFLKRKKVIYRHLNSHDYFVVVVGRHKQCLYLQNINTKQVNPIALKSFNLLYTKAKEEELLLYV